MARRERSGRAKAILEALATALVPLLLRLFARSWSIRVLNRRVAEECIDPGRPVLVATWHQMILPGVAYYRDRGALIMVSRSRDGELMAKVNRRMGFGSVRGSSSRGGAEALHALIERLRGGAQAAVMVDGPRGPARDPKPGVVLAASRSGAPLIPLGCRVKPALYGRNWDRTIIPLPFSTVVLCYGEPIRVPPDLSPEDIERYRLQVRDGLLAAEERAERSIRD
jgi:lysophospholipid acyltransferase (LPLAT)-like uncharacterized protein